MAAMLWTWGCPGGPDIEVVVLSSSSREELLKTHSRYFRSAEEIFEHAGA
jgi:hypothetical protein